MQFGFCKLKYVTSNISLGLTCYVYSRFFYKAKITNRSITFDKLDFIYLILNDLYYKKNKFLQIAL